MCFDLNCSDTFLSGEQTLTFPNLQESDLFCKQKRRVTMDKVANLVNAERRDDMGVVFYTSEFTVEGPAFSRHNVAVYATSGGELFSLNAQSPKALWPNVQNQFREMASSFGLLR